MTLSWLEVRSLYRNGANRDDLTANSYYLIGIRERHCRQRAADAQQLKKGDMVVKIGCGTGR